MDHRGNSTRRVIFVALLCSFAATPAMADFYGGRVSSNRIAGYYASNGGEFTLSSNGGPGLLLDLSAYEPGVTSNVAGSTATPSFQTFCIEYKEYVGSPMDIVVSETWTGGTQYPQWDPTNPHDPASHAIYGGKPLLGGDDLNPATAYLYTRFATGVLSDYNYGAGRNVSAGQLQRAIWSLEEEITLGVSDVQANAWVAEALASGWDDIGNVRVLNTWGAGHINDLNYRRQDQLYLTPVPGAVLLGMIGLSIAGVKLRRFA